MPDLTPEQEARAQEAFARRRFDPESYQKEIMGPALAPALQVAVAEAELAAMDPALGPVAREAMDAETLAAQKAKNEDIAQEFAFLDPADYADPAARTGKTMLPEELQRKLRDECHLTCWFSLASAAMIAKELNPRDVALAYRKIGQNQENLHDPERWQDAIAEIRQEEAGKQAMCTYDRLGLQVVRAGTDSPQYVTWIPGCLLREFSLVKFDEYGVPDWYIPGWRDVVLALVRQQFISQDVAAKVFGEAVGPAARRYNMIMQGLREEQLSSQVITAEPAEGAEKPLTTEAQRHRENLKACGKCGETAVDCQCFNLAPEPTPCLECHRRMGHFPFCSQYEAWYNGLGAKS